MRDFGTFDTLTDEEDTIYNRLAYIHRERERLDYNQNEAQQEIKLLKYKIEDDKFKVKFWLIIALIFGFFALPWYQLILMVIPPGVSYGVGYIMNVIATFVILVSQFVMLPLCIIFSVVFLVWLVIHILRNGKKDNILKMAETMGVTNRNVLIAEQKQIIKETYQQDEIFKAEEEKLQKRLREIKRDRDDN